MLELCPERQVEERHCASFSRGVICLAGERDGLGPHAPPLQHPQPRGPRSPDSPWGDDVTLRPEEEARFQEAEERKKEESGGGTV